MMLPLFIAEQITHYICDKFYEYEGVDKTEFLEDAAYCLNCEFYVSWGGAGSYGNCWDDKIVEFEASDEPLFIELENFLSTYFPDTEKKGIYDFIEYKTHREHDYYGGITTTHQKSIKLLTVIEYLLPRYTHEICLDEMLESYGNLVGVFDDFESIKKSISNG